MNIVNYWHYWQAHDQTKGERDIIYMKAIVDIFRYISRYLIVQFKAVGPGPEHKTLQDSVQVCSVTQDSGYYNAGCYVTLYTGSIYTVQCVVSWSGRRTTLAGTFQPSAASLPRHHHHH